jgi:hypothetical protein
MLTLRVRPLPRSLTGLTASPFERIGTGVLQLGLAELPDCKDDEDGWEVTLGRESEAVEEAAEESRRVGKMLRPIITI